MYKSAGNVVRNLGRLGNRWQVLAAVCAVGVISAGAGALLIRGTTNNHQVAAVKGAATVHPSHAGKAASSAASPDSTSKAAGTKTSAPSSTQAVKGTSTTPAPKSASNSPATIGATQTTPVPPQNINLDLGTLTFDNYTDSLIVTFDLPLSASAAGPVTMTVIRQETGATLCSQTVNVAANEDEDFHCSYTPTEAPHMVHAIVTAGTASAQSSNVYDGYFAG